MNTIKPLKDLHYPGDQLAVVLAAAQGTCITAKMMADFVTEFAVAGGHGKRGEECATLIEKTMWRVARTVYSTKEINEFLVKIGATPTAPARATIEVTLAIDVEAQPNSSVQFNSPSNDGGIVACLPTWLLNKSNRDFAKIIDVRWGTYNVTKR